MQRILTLLLLLSAVCYGRGLVDVEVESEVHQPKFGQATTITYKIHTSEGVELELPEILEAQNPAFEIQEKELVSLSGEEHKLRLKVAVFDTDEHPLRLEIPYRFEGQLRSQPTPPVIFTVEKPVSDDYSDIRGPAPTVDVGLPTEIKLVGLGTIFLLLGGLVLGIRRWRSPKTFTPYERVVHSLQSLKNNPTGDSSTDIFGETSYILRRFVSDLTEEPLLEKNTDEIEQILATDPDFIEILRQADLVRFSGKTPSLEETSEFLEQSSEFIDNFQHKTEEKGVLGR